MTKRIFSLGVLLMSMLACFTLSSCGSDNDNEPTTTNVRQSDLTNPWMLINAEDTDDNGFCFLAFNSSQVAQAIMSADGNIYDVIISSWELKDGKLYIGNRSVGKVEKATQDGVTVIIINGIMYVPSNIDVDGEGTIEDIFTHEGITRAQFWEILVSLSQGN